MTLLEVRDSKFDVRLSRKSLCDFLFLNLLPFSNFEPRTSNLEYSALTVCKHTVSGAISLPSRGAFHLSLTVLVHYRSHGVFSLGGWSPLIPTGFLVSRGTWDPLVCVGLFIYRAVTFCVGPFQTASIKSTDKSDESPATPAFRRLLV